MPKRFLIVWLALTAAALSAADPVQFNRDIRPILSDKCFACHGPDEGKRISGLRLDDQQSALRDLGGRYAIKPGAPDDSEVYKRITQQNEALRMPPTYSSKTLNPNEIDLIRLWIEQGAQWQGHWAFIPPVRPADPEVSDPSWAAGSIDRFVMARLDREGLRPSPEADRTDLIRRVSFDLTGLPPTLAEVDAFVADHSPDAYEKVVDRLLRSPRYGERMAIRWLDAARYADTNGYQTDAERVQWRWRDWVIDAFNHNMPFDQFTIEQLAGDLLPNPTTDQIVATGFNRNHRGNSEGGIVAEEYLVEYGVDRVDTTATVWMGLTLGCARCHDHKFDPLKQSEYYQVFAYFNNIPERGRIFKFGNTPPVVAAPTDVQRRELAELDSRLETARNQFNAHHQKLADDLETDKWLADPLAKFPGRRLGGWAPDWQPERGLAAHFSLDDEPGSVPGRVGAAVGLDGEHYVVGGDQPDFGYLDAFTISAWVKADAPNGAIVAKSDRALDDQGYGFGGWGLYLIDGKLKFLAMQRWLDDGLRVATEQDLPLGGWHHVAVSYDGSRLSKGVRFYVDGKPWRHLAELDFVNQEIRRNAPVLIGHGGGLEQGFVGMIDEVRLYSEALSPELLGVLATSDTLDQIARTPQSERTPGQRDKLRLAYLERYGDADVRKSWQQLVSLQREREKLLAGFPTVMVMQELPGVGDTFRLDRGAYDAPAEKVSRGVPAALNPFPPGLPNNRLGLAKWLTSDDHPLTARVTVNRLWQMLFGRGIVKTVEDFGSQGDWPTHPKLLDWLAREFVESGWNVKGLVKTIVMSATYRQSSDTAPESVERDPENRLLARGPRIRLPAEMVRDQALALAGLLVEKVGGPSVKPYQPAGVWKELSGQTYHQGTGDELYRRSLYTFWKRSAPPPFMMNFDSAGREACTVTQQRTNTPLQALNLMNDVTYVEASRKIAERMMRQGGPTPESRIDYGFRLATARHPKQRERDLLAESFRYYLDRYQSNPDEAAKLLAHGDSSRDESLDRTEHAAYSAVASLILNLDEVITKP